MGSLSTPQTGTLAIRAGGLVGAMQDAEPANSPSAHAHFDACPIWLELAVRHLSDAQVGRDARIEAWRGADERSRTGALEWEFEASLQAIMAAATAVDSMYAAVQKKVPLPQPLIDEWRDSRAPRDVRISDVLSLAFSLEPSHASSARQALAEIFRFRDLAIDPSGKIDAQVLHPELGVGVEWRFVYFRYESAALIVKATVRLVTELVASAHPHDADLRKYVDALRPRLEALQNANALRSRVQNLDL
jgi:hypothetical protein